MSAPAAAAVPALAAKSLSKSFGRVVALDDVSFTVPYAAVTGFVGSNGSGKTTTIRMLLGLTVPSRGAALVAGSPPSELRDPRRTVGAALDRLGAHPGVSGRNHLRLLCTAAGLPRTRVDEVLQLVDLSGPSDRRVGGYSTGMRQRLALAAALLGDPRILVLDEPSNGLDPAGIRWLRDLMRDRADRGAAVLVSTHQLAELSTVADHLVVLDRGRVVANGPTATVLGASGVATIEDLLLSDGGAR